VAASAGGHVAGAAARRHQIESSASARSFQLQWRGWRRNGVAAKMAAYLIINGEKRRLAWRRRLIIGGAKWRRRRGVAGVAYQWLA